MERQREFNITGPCIPTLHYMVDTSEKIDQIIREYVDRGEYFTINRARQYGKTTTLELLRRKLQNDYIVLDISFEGKEDYFESNRALATGICVSMARVLKDFNANLYEMLRQPVDELLPFECLSDRIAQLCQQLDKGIVLMIDEVDKASNNAVFLSFLGLLCDKYIERSKKNTLTFKSVILAGVHDIKNLKMKLRPEEKHSYNSPWNIAARFDVDLSFSAPEIASMLREYEADHNTGMDIAAVSERLYYYTSGYPFLVSDLCKTMHDEQLPWTVEGVDEAEKRIVKGDNALFDDIIKNLTNLSGFGTLVKQILVYGVQVAYQLRNPDIDLGLMYGIFKERDSKVVVANIIFETIIFDHFISVSDTKMLISPYTEGRSQFIQDGHLNIPVVLERFAAFMRSEYRDEDSAFIETEGRLLLLCFLKPIINGVGHYAVEPETADRSRMDIVVFYGKDEHIIELKIWRGQKAAAKAYDQLTGYLESRGQKRGYLLSFCDNRKAPRGNRSFEHKGYHITEVIVAYRDKEKISPKPCKSIPFLRVKGLRREKRDRHARVSKHTRQAGCLRQTV